MDFAVAMPTKATSWEVAARAEQLGFSHAWFYDTTLLNAEPFAAMGAAAMKTSKIKLGTGVIVPSNRLAPVAASGLATLNALAPGRIVFGVSTGFTARRTMGLKAITQDHMVEYIEVVRGLLAGKTVEFEEEGRHKIRFLNPELGLINIKDPVPLAISAFGPKGRAIAAKLGAQWIGSGIDPESEKAELQDFRTQWAANGHDPKDQYIIRNLSGCVLDEGQGFDSPKTMAQAGPGVSVLFHAMVEQVDASSGRLSGDFPFKEELEAYRKVYQAYEPADARYMSNHRGHLMFVRPDEKHVTGRLIKAMSMTGTKAELVERLGAMKARGVHQVQFNLVPGHENEMMERWADVAAQL